MERGRLFVCFVICTLLQVWEIRGQCSDTADCHPPVENLVYDVEVLTQRTLTVTSTCTEGTTYKSQSNGDSANYTCANFVMGNMIDSVAVPQSPIDGPDKAPRFDTYWQSANAYNEISGEMDPQEIIFNFTDPFLINEVQVSFISPHANSLDGRPQAMCIDRWVDGAWSTWRCFASTCNQYPGIAVYNEAIHGELSAYCLDFERNGVTQEPGIFDIELHPSLDIHDFAYNQTVIDHFSTSAVRLLLTNPANPSPERSFYAIAHVKIDAECICNGHAATCTGVNKNECVCGHNTESPHCETCMAMFRDKPWSLGTPTDPGVCQLCDCNQYAEACEYDETLGHGVCTNCSGQTTGNYCDQCVDAYFINPASLPNATVAPVAPGTQCSGYNDTSIVTYDCNDYCHACDCSRDGTVATNFLCNTTSGQCECKTHVQGRRCDECKDMFHSLVNTSTDGCTSCQCNPLGTFNSSNFCDKLTGNCVCKTNTEGQMCQSCKAETYNLDIDNVADGCTNCECDVGAAMNNQCNVVSGQCTCRGTLNTRDCKQPAFGQFVPKLDYFTYEAEFADFSAGGTYVAQPGHGQSDATVTGLGYVQIAPGGSVVFDMQLPGTVSSNFLVIFRYKLEGTSATANAVVQMQNAAEYTCGGQTYPATQTWQEILTFSGPQENAHSAMATTMTCMNGGIPIKITFQANVEMFLDSVVLIPDILTTAAFTNSSVETQQIMNSCRELSKNVDLTNRASLNCSTLEYSLMAELIDGSIACSCNATGSLNPFTCEGYGGQCPCKEGIILRQCTHCQVDSYLPPGSTDCIACDCDPLGSVTLFCSDQGVCECKTNVTGAKCDQCVADNFGHQTGAGCTLCQCNLDYSYNNSCNDTGQCPCLPGVNGQVCASCMDGFFNLTTTGCTACTCNAFGSNSDMCDTASGICNCRANVQGDTCAECKPTYFGLGDWSSDGCLLCQCSGHTDNCTTGEGWFSTITESHWPLSVELKARDVRWTGIDDQRINVTVDDPTIFGDDPVNDPLAQYVMRLINTGDNVNKLHLYFLAPLKFLGDKRTAYGRTMTIEIRVSTNESIMTGYTEGDVILQAKNLPFSLTRNLPTVPMINRNTYQIPLNEVGWFVDSTVGPPATYVQMISTLEDLGEFRIRGKFSNAVDSEVDLYQVVMEHASKNVSNVSVNNVELCTCPEIYRGDFCESCAFGYRRADPTAGVRGECVTCDCNGHAGGPCDSETGVCMCTHNTTGDKCELCLPGFYGNALNGQPDDCKPCTCPGNVVDGEANVFAIECNLDPATSGPICVNCTEGHEGNMCESCKEGYYGQPANVSNNNGNCAPCVCNGRADTCDRETGICVNCRDNTGGKECDQCGPFFYGFPNLAPCTPCTCTASVGATGECHHQTGQCTCKPNVEGFSCDRCAVNSFNFSSGLGCTPCDCHPNGASLLSCDLVSGQCSCSFQKIGRQCDMCIDEYYGLNDFGSCIPCVCNAQGSDASFNGTCALDGGQCYCQNAATIGRQCDRCSEVTSGTYTHIQLFSLGEFPNCGICGECFDSWATRLDDIGTQIFAQFDEVDAIWANYGRSTASQAEPTLSSIRDNIQSAESSITRVGEFTSALLALETGLQEVSNRSTTIDADADVLQNRYNVIEDLYANLTTFIGTIDINNTTKSINSLEGELVVLEGSINNVYNQGNTTWQNIRQLSILVGDTGDKSRELQTRVDNAMRILSVAMETYQVIVRLYNESFLTGFNNNELALDTAREIVDEASLRLGNVTVIVDTTSSQLITANFSLKSVEASSAAINATMASLRDESVYTSVVAEQVLQEAKDTLVIVREYLSIARMSMDNLTSSFTDVVEGINTLTELGTKLTDFEIKEQAVEAITLRTEAEMMLKANEIRGVVVDVDLIDITNQKADGALLVAQTAMNKTSKARDDSLLVKAEVEGIQAALVDSATLRTEGNAIDLDSKAKNQSIYDVLGYFQSNTSEVTRLASTTSNYINNVNTIIMSVNTCFNSLAANAATSKANAEAVLNRVNQTAQEVGSLAPLIQSINDRVSVIGNGSALTSIENTNSQLSTVTLSFDRVESVTDIQVLLQNFQNLKNEVDTLDTELNVMEPELDALVNDLTNLVNSDSSSCTSTTII